MTPVSTEFLLLWIGGIVCGVELLHHTIGTAEHDGTSLCTGDFAEARFDYRIVTNETFIWNAVLQWRRGRMVIG